MIYFKSDNPTAQVKGLVPLDYYGLEKFAQDPLRFRLLLPVVDASMPLKPEYEFESDDGTTGWPEAVLAVKNFPRVFGVPWQVREKEGKKEKKDLTLIAVGATARARGS